MELDDSSNALARTAYKAIIAVIVIAALYLGKELFVPLAISILLAFVLSPIVLALRKFGIPRSLGVAITVALTFALIFAAGTTITTQVTELGNQLPQYESALKQKIRALNSFTGSKGSAIDRATETLRDLQQELDKAGQADASSPSTPAAGEQGKPISPIPVEIHPAPPTALEQIESIIAVALSPLATAGVIIVFVVFLLLKQTDVRDRAIRLMGVHDLQKATVALDDAGRRLSSYFLVLLLMNAGFGAVVAIGLWILGIPSAMLWGIVGMLLRFVPIIGVFIAAAIPVLLAAAVNPGWTMVIGVIALYMIVEGIMNLVVEPLAQSSTTGLSALAILVAATFWTLLWGPIGLLLAIPLTAVLVVMGRHLEGLDFLHVLLGDSPPLTAPEQFYQRMLAGDPIETTEQAEAYLKDHTLVEYLDDILIPALSIAQSDADRSRLDQARLPNIQSTADAVLGNVVNLSLTDHESEFSEKAPRSVEWQADDSILCVSGPSLLDEFCAERLATSLRELGFKAKLMTFKDAANAQLEGAKFEDTRLVCIVLLNANQRLPHLKLLTRRIHRLIPKARHIAALWGQATDVGAPEIPADLIYQKIARSLDSSIKLVLEIAGNHDLAHGQLGAIKQR